MKGPNGKFSTSYDENDVLDIPADYIIMATGQKVGLEFLGDKFASQLKTERGLIGVDKETFRTNNDKMYAGGDAVTGPDIAIRAISAGRVAARSINRGLGGEEFAAFPASRVKTFDSLGVAETRMNLQPELPVAERSLTAEDTGSYPEGVAAKEAARCFNCGCLAVNSSDVATMLVAYRASVKTTERTLSAAELLASRTRIKDVLRPGEIVTEIIVPAQPEGTVAAYDKYRIRDSVDFAVTAVASVYTRQGRRGVRREHRAGRVRARAARGDGRRGVHHRQGAHEGEREEGGRAGPAGRHPPGAQRLQDRHDPRHGRAQPRVLRWPPTRSACWPGPRGRGSSPSPPGRTPPGRPSSRTAATTSRWASRRTARS